MALELKTERLRLRAPNEGDLQRIAILMSDWEVAKWLAVVPYPYTLEDADEFLERQKVKTPPNFSLVLDNGEGAIGLMGLQTPKADFGGAEVSTLEIGYWLGAPYWGRGYATEAGEAVVAHAFDVLDVQKLVAGAATENTASLRVLDKLGFEVTGHGTYFCRPQNKKVADTRVALKRSRWRTLQAIG